MEYADIHQKIRDIRRKRKITIQELSDRTGLTQGYLSKIENSPKPPPIPTLVKIAYGLDVHISSFFEDDDDGQPSGPTIILEHERKELIGDYTSLGYRYEALIEKRSSGSIKPLLITLPKRMDPEGVPYNSHDGEELIYVLAGCLDFYYGDEIHRVSKGASLFFDAMIPHKIVAAEKQTQVKVLAVLSLNN